MRAVDEKQRNLYGVAFYQGTLIFQLQQSVWIMLVSFSVYYKQTTQLTCHRTYGNYEIISISFL